MKGVVLMAMVPYGRRQDERLGNPFYGMMNGFFGDMWPSVNGMRGFKVDVSESETDYTVEADLPGINKEDITLSLHDGALVIRVKSEREQETEKDRYIHRERSRTDMTRSVYLGEAADESAAAKLQNGVLRITVPKRADGPRSRNIPIDG